MKRNWGSDNKAGKLTGHDKEGEKSNGSKKEGVDEKKL